MIERSYNSFDTTGFYEGWAILPDLPANRRGRLDINGPLNLPNLLAYAMGIHPLTAQASDMPAFIGRAANPNQGILRFRRNPDSLDTTLRVWASPDLSISSWVPAVMHTPAILHSGPGWQQIEAIVDLPTSDMGFFRRSVESEE